MIDHGAIAANQGLTGLAVQLQLYEKKVSASKFRVIQRNPQLKQRLSRDPIDRTDQGLKWPMVGESHTSSPLCLVQLTENVLAGLWSSPMKSLANEELDVHASN